MALPNLQQVGEVKVGAMGSYQLGLSGLLLNVK